MSTPPPPPRHHITAISLLLPLAAATFIFTLIILLLLLLRHLRHQKPAFSTVCTFPRRFSYAILRRATSKFSTSRRLGHGGSGVVFLGTLTLNPDTKLPVAVKLMDSSSLQSELEFHNEIMISKHLVDSERIVKQLGFASSRRKGHLCLVYEFMANGNLQDCLLHKKCVELMEWSTRFSIVLQVAQGLACLHHQCDPPVIHGDVKPSNILLDENFCAKIGDFGLARLNLVDNSYSSHLVLDVNDNGSVIKSESVGNMVAFEGNVGGDQSPEMVTAPASPLEFFDVESDIEGQFDIGHEVVKEENLEDSNNENIEGSNSVNKMNDYVIEWIGTDVDKQKPLSSWLAASSSAGVICKGEEIKKGKKGLKRWVSKIDGRIMKKKKRREGREWWKEQYCEELSMKKTMKKKKHNWWFRDDRNKIRGESWSTNNVNWLFDGQSGDLNRTTQAQAQTRLASYDSISGEILKSGGISSTPSVRGTVCYIAPEYSTGSDLSEKCDVYSFGVLILVVIAGRRPLQVTDSPMSEFHRANLLLWARQLARTGKFLDLVDENVGCLDKEQARLCIVVALLCLQKSPDRRPSMKEVVGMLVGELDPPHLPKEYSSYPFKSRKKLW